MLFLFRHELTDEARAIEKALTHFAEAARLAPLDVEYARAYAETFYGVPKADWRAAAEAWEHVREISPNPDFALVNLARVHLRMGQHGAAAGFVERIQSPEFERVKAKIKSQIAEQTKAANAH